MEYEAFEGKFEWMELFGHEVAFTDVNLDIHPPHPWDVPDGLYRYALRHGDDDAYPVSLEPVVIVNYFGTVFSRVPLMNAMENWRKIDEDDWGFLSDKPDCTLEEYANETDESM